MKTTLLTLALMTTALTDIADAESPSLEKIQAIAEDFHYLPATRPLKHGDFGKLSPVNTRVVKIVASDTALVELKWYDVTGSKKVEHTQTLQMTCPTKGLSKGQPFHGENVYAVNSIKRHRDSKGFENVFVMENRGAASER